jgi:hypothetical protein
MMRALKRGELDQCPHILTVSVGKTPPMGRPLDAPEPRPAGCGAAEFRRSSSGRLRRSWVIV